MPQVHITELAQAGRRTGLTQIALPYAQDPAITRHLAGFLTRQARLAEGRAFVHPTAILFNGGVFKAAVLKTRVVDVVNSWLTSDGGAPVKEIAGADLDLAVARGAAYYGWVRHGHGIRIRGGTARAYYVGVEAAMPAVPGFEPPVPRRVRCPVRYGRRNPGRHSATGICIGGWRTDHLSLFCVFGPTRRSCRRRDRECCAQ